MATTLDPPRRSASRTRLDPAVVLGVGLGAFFDGTVLHQVLQWHRMISSTDWMGDEWLGVDAALLADGLFHVFALLVTTAGAFLLVERVRADRRRPSWTWFVGGLLVGWALFNLVEGAIDHHLLDVHHVREVEGHLVYDLGFMALSVALLVGGLRLRRR